MPDTVNGVFDRYSTGIRLKVLVKFASNRVLRSSRQVLASGIICTDGKGSPASNLKREEGEESEHGLDTTGGCTNRVSRRAGGWSEGRCGQRIVSRVHLIDIAQMVQE